MNIGEIVSDSIGYPLSNWTKVIILGIMTIACILIVPIPLVAGYVFRIIKSSLAGFNELPEFDDWGEMFVDGLKVIIVGIVYAIPLWIIAAILGLGKNAAMSSGDISGALAGGLLIGYLIYFIIAIIIGFIEYIAIANMAYYDGEIGAAFRFSELIDRISRIGWLDYIVWYIVLIIIGFVIGIISVISMVILIGFILVPLIIAPYMAMFWGRYLALLYTSSE